MANESISGGTVLPGNATEAAFQYEAQTVDGRTLRGVLEGKSAQEVQSKLAALQLRVLAVDPAKEIKLREAQLGPDDFLAFNQQFAHLAAAGLPVEHGLRLIAADLKSGRLADAARAVADDLESGVPLSTAFTRHASRFPPLYGHLVDAGVKTGNLPGMLFNLGHHLELVGRLRRALWRTLSYPAMVLGAMSLVLLFISMVVLPQFQQIYTDFRTTLPAITEFIFAVGRVYPYFLAGVAGLVVLVAIIVGVMRLTGNGGVLADQVLVHLPAVGPVIRAGLIARWTDALRVGIDSGLDLPRAIAMASEATGSKRLLREGQEMSDLLVSGKPFQQFQGRLIPHTVPASIELAARTGDLPSALATLSRMYQEQAEQRIRLVPVIVMPVSLLVIAATMGMAVTAIFLPLIRLIRAVSGGEF